MLAVVGGIALVLGAIFFLSLAFSRGWITEPLRVLIGLVAGAALLVLGELSFTRLRGALGHVLVAVGLAIIALALLAATRLYHVVPRSATRSRRSARTARQTSETSTSPSSWIDAAAVPHSFGRCRCVSSDHRELPLIA